MEVLNFHYFLKFSLADHPNFFNSRPNSVIISYYVYKVYEELKFKNNNLGMLQKICKF